jgi:hypothetical protein
MKDILEKYLRVHGERGPWQLETSSPEEIQHAVVIPALAEYPAILETLYRLSRNAPDALRKTLVVCVVNNRPPPHTAEKDIANNQRTVSLLRSLIRRQPFSEENNNLLPLINAMKGETMRLALVDVSSPGLELPRHMGVGMARKIGADLSLAAMNRDGGGRKNIIFHLDADTWVEPSYLQETIRHFQEKSPLSAVLSFAHRSAPDGALQEAINVYESYLRYYVIGLRYALSPYAFHTIGSTMAATALGYASVRGIPKRLAGEDFYFLNKMARLEPVSFIKTTTVFPSPRISTRTPFGTGKTIHCLTEGEKTEAMFYHPRAFAVLRSWLALISQETSSDAKTIMARAGDIDPLLPAFLTLHHFPEVWYKLKRNFSSPANLIRQFHVWFDGLKTFKLIRFLSAHRHHRLPIADAFTALMTMIKAKPVDFAGTESSAILAYLRSIENDQ